MRSSKAVKRMLCLVMIATMLFATAMPALASSSSKGAYVVTTSKKHDRLRVHSSPWGSVVDYLKRGTVVVYKSSKSGWWKVEYYGGSGYVDKSYLTSVTSLSSAKYKAITRLSVYTKPKSSSTYLGTLKTGVKVSIVGKSGSWVHIAKGAAHGWVLAKYLYRVS